MTKHPVALAIALALSVSVVLPGCDSTANLTEQEHIQRAKDFEDKGNFKGSIVELKNAIQKNPDSTQARLLLGQVYLKVGQGAEAEKELSQAEKLGVNRESIKPQLGEALLLMGEYQRLLDEIQPGEQTSKGNLARIFQMRADALLKQGKLKEACNLFQQSLDTETNNPPTYWGLAQCAVAERDMKKAKEWLDSALKIKDKQAKTWVFLGDWEQLNNNSAGALAAYTSALKFEPNNLEALRSRAILNMALGHTDLARTDIEKIGKMAPESISAHYLQALFLYKQQKYVGARDALQQVFQITPDHMPSVLLAGATSFSLGSYEQAESYLNRFLTRIPGHAYARRMLAATQIKQYQSDKALETLAPLLSSDTKDAQALALASDAYLIKRQPEKAAALLERAALIDPKSASVQTQLGLAHLASGDTLRALTELGAAAALDPGQHKADSLLVQALLDHKEYDKALVVIDAMEKRSSSNAVTLNMRANAYLGKNDLSNARKSFEQALVIDPTFFPAAVSLAQLDMHDKQPNVARKRFERILDQDKNNLQAMMALAELAAINGQERDYVGWLEKAAKAHPEAIPPLAALARHHLSKNEPQDALAVANEAVNANPDNPEVLNLLGAAQMATGDKTNAIATFTKLTKKANPSPEVYLRLAKAQIADKRFADARITLQKALQLQPDHLPSQDTLISLELTQNKPEAALLIARQIQTQQPNSPLGYDREADIQLDQKHLPQAIKAYEQALEKGAGSVGLIKLHHAQSLAGFAKPAEQRLSDWLKQHPNDNTVRGYVAAYYMLNGRNNEAIAQYQEIQRQTPNSALVLNNLANLYQREQDNRALTTAEQALKLAPDNPAIQDTLGWILVEQGQAPRGLELLRKAVAKPPKVASIRYHYAVALARTGDNIQARKMLEDVLRYEPKFPEAEAAKILLKNL